VKNREIVSSLRNDALARTETRRNRLVRVGETPVVSIGLPSDLLLRRRRAKSSRTRTCALPRARRDFPVRSRVHDSPARLASLSCPCPKYSISQPLFNIISRGASQSSKTSPPPPQSIQISRKMSHLAKNLYSVPGETLLHLPRSPLLPPALLPRWALLPPPYCNSIFSTRKCSSQACGFWRTC
jgi:hypothetical protein